MMRSYDCRAELFPGMLRALAVFKVNVWGANWKPWKVLSQELFPSELLSHVSVERDIEEKWTRVVAALSLWSGPSQHAERDDDGAECGPAGETLESSRSL